VAEHRAANDIQTKQELSSAPAVHVAGFPFLTQLASGTLSTVDVTAHNVVAGQNGRTVRIQRLGATLHHVVLHGYSSATAKTVSAAVVLDYAELSSVLGAPVSYGGSSADGNGRLQAHASATLAGVSVSGAVNAEVSVTDNAIRFVDPHVTVDGSSLPGDANAALAAVFATPLSLAGLPFHLTLQSVHARPGGVTISLTARDVTYG
jgi:LmeA-like phospholipid-binding